MASEENRKNPRQGAQTMDNTADRTSPRIFLIHATPLAIAAINDSFKKLWPEAKLANLLEDSLTADLQQVGKIDQALTDRFIKLARYAHETGADGIIFTCSAFGPAINACKDALPIPVLRPNEAMVEEAMTYGDRLALMATFEPAIAPITAEVHQYASSIGRSVTIDQIYVSGALKAAQDGDQGRHNDLIAQAATAAKEADVIGFAQFSMSQAAADLCAEVTGKPVLTTPDSAVRLMRKLLSETAKNDGNSIPSKPSL